MFPEEESRRRPSREQCRFLPPAATRRGRARRYAGSLYIWRSWRRGRGTAATCCWPVPLSSHSVPPASASVGGPGPPPRRRRSRLVPPVFGQCRWRRRPRWRVCRQHRRNRRLVRNTRRSARISNCNSCWHCAAGTRRGQRRRRIERGRAVATSRRPAMSRASPAPITNRLVPRRWLSPLRRRWRWGCARQPENHRRGAPQPRPSFPIRQPAFPLPHPSRLLRRAPICRLTRSRP